MSVFISDIDTVEIYVQFFRPTTNLNINAKNELSGRLRELKHKEKVQLGNPKSGRGRLRELFITTFKSNFKRVFYKGGRN